jgi:putative hydrolase of the HAD superfamily
MPRFDAVIFDLFGTLVHTVTPDAYTAMLSELSALLGVSHETFTRRWRATIEDRESGELSDIAGVLRSTASAVGGTPTGDQVAGAAKRWMAIAGGWLVARDNAREVLERVRQSGSLVGLLSNCSAEVPPLWPGGTLDLFDATVFSCDVGAMKPDRKVYDAACERLGVQAEALHVRW